METKYFHSNNNRGDIYEHTYVNKLYDGFLIFLVSFNSECVRVWIHPRITDFLDPADRQHYDEFPINENSDAEDFLYLAKDIDAIIRSADFNSEHPAWTFVRLIEDGI